MLPMGLIAKGKYLNPVYFVPSIHVNKKEEGMWSKK